MLGFLNMQEVSNIGSSLEFGIADRMQVATYDPPFKLSNKRSDFNHVEGAPSKPVDSDSAYYSGLVTETESVCSVGPVASSLGLSWVFLQEFVAFFGDILAEKAGARAWAGSALAQHTPEVIEQRLNNMLKDYVAEVFSTARISRNKERHTISIQTGGKFSKIDMCATMLIHEYRPIIARYFRENAIWAPTTADLMAVRLQELSRKFTLLEKVALFESQAQPENMRMT